MASPISETWAHATAMLQNPDGGRGSGFLVARSVAPDQWRVFLFTNKHVIHKEPAERRGTRALRLYMNAKRPDGHVGAEAIDISLTGASPFQWREHPSEDVDVYAVEITGLLASRSDLQFKFVTDELFATEARRTELDITAGDEIVVVGYPLGMTQGATNYPLIRQGIIATRIGEELWEEVQNPGGVVTIRKVRGFLVDGATVPGSSGSPVVLKPLAGRFQGGNIVMGFTPPVLLGIVAETRYAPIRTPKGAIPSFAGLGLAFDVETIAETLALF